RRCLGHPPCRNKGWNTGLSIHGFPPLRQERARMGHPADLTSSNCTATRPQSSAYSLPGSFDSLSSVRDPSIAGTGSGVALFGCSPLLGRQQLIDVVVGVGEGCPQALVRSCLAIARQIPSASLGAGSGVTRAIELGGPQLVQHRQEVRD